MSNLSSLPLATTAAQPGVTCVTTGEQPASADSPLERARTSDEFWPGDDSIRADLEIRERKRMQRNKLILFIAPAGQHGGEKRENSGWSDLASPCKIAKCRSLARYPTGDEIPAYSHPYSEYQAPWGQCCTTCWNTFNFSDCLSRRAAVMCSMLCFLIYEGDTNAAAYVCSTRVLNKVWSQTSNGTVVTNASSDT